MFWYGAHFTFWTHSLNSTTVAFSSPLMNEQILVIMRTSLYTKNKQETWRNRICHFFLQVVFKKGREMLPVHPIKS